MKLGSNMDVGRVVALGLGGTAPWRLTGQHLTIDTQPHELHLDLTVDRGALFPCPICGKLCKAHDFDAFTWRHLNFFEYHCYVTARVPRMLGPVHGIKRVGVPWARPGSRFTFLFEQAALALVREMPVLAAARAIGITNNRLWRIVENYVGRAVEKLAMSTVKTVGIDSAAFERASNRVTVFLDLDDREKPMIFATVESGEAALTQFQSFFADHGGANLKTVELIDDPHAGRNALPAAYVTARERARSHRSADAFVTIMYLLAAPLGDL